jgi:HK97 family phage major capsid protein
MSGSVPEATVSAYLQQLTEKADEITRGIVEIEEAAANEGRDLTEDESLAIAREDAERDKLIPVIERHQELANKAAKVATIRAQVPTRPTAIRVNEPPPQYDICREFPSAGHYAATLHRALVKKDPEAIAAIERATAHQTTDDNPGIIPRPIVEPLINLLDGSRPLVASVPNHPAPAMKFDRPRVDQHVEVQKQTAEKTETASQEMKINPVAVSLDTWAGHVNISKQDLRWSQPSILQVIFDDFTRMYGRRTDNDACAEFPAAITATAPLVDYSIAAVDKFLRDAAGDILTISNDAVIDTIWMSTDVWSGLGGSRTSTGIPAFNLPLTGGGDVLGLKPVLDPHFAPQTLIVGLAEAAEFWEDIEGFLTVDEPNVLGQLVGYAGYCDFVVLQPAAFMKASGLPVPTGAGAAAADESKRTPRR